MTTTDPLIYQRPVQRMLDELQQESKRLELHAQIVRVFATEQDEARAAEKVWNILNPYARVISDKLSGRAALIKSQIARHVRGPKVLDFGCGDGKVAETMTSEGISMTTFDVDDYRIEAKSLPFDKGWATRLDEFDTALVITVLHHCNEPDLELESLHRVARRLVVIESVVDGDMPFEAQAVVDWIYNRGMHPGANIPVPGQFRTAEAWRVTFARHGLRVIHEDDLGVDLPVVPEHHYLFVCERNF
ncbi:MAG: methyltransferase domain-containing protein [Patescibacteria group bacterium]|nr:methyltransferase domain-containing protein [Patescibacteria group bacterium]